MDGLEVARPCRQAEAVLHRAMPHMPDLGHVDRTNFVMRPTFEAVHHGARMARVGHTRLEAHGEPNLDLLGAVAHEPTIEVTDVGTALQERRRERIRHTEVEHDSAGRQGVQDLFSGAIFCFSGNPDLGISAIRVAGGVMNAVCRISCFGSNLFHTRPTFAEHQNGVPLFSQGKHDRTSNLRGGSSDEHLSSFQFESLDQRFSLLDHDCRGERITMDNRDLEGWTELVDDVLTASSQPLGLGECAEAEDGGPSALCIEHRIENSTPDTLAPACLEEVPSEVPDEPGLAFGIMQFERVNDIVGSATDEVDNACQVIERSEHPPAPRVLRILVEIFHPVQQPVPVLNPMGQEHDLHFILRVRDHWFPPPATADRLKGRYYPLSLQDTILVKRNDKKINLEISPM